MCTRRGRRGGTPRARPSRSSASPGSSSSFAPPIAEPRGLGELQPRRAGGQVVGPERGARAVDVAELDEGGRRRSRRCTSRRRRRSAARALCSRSHAASRRTRPAGRRRPAGPGVGAAPVRVVPERAARGGDPGPLEPERLVSPRRSGGRISAAMRKPRGRRAWSSREDAPDLRRRAAARRGTRRATAFIASARR